MKKCKCRGCKNKVESRVYCSSSCRTRTTNKLYKDYRKTADTIRRNKELPYNANPKYCETCGVLLSYELRHNKFCNHSCAATYNNTHREKRERIFSKDGIENIRAANYKRWGVTSEFRKKRPCIFCKTKLVKRSKSIYCSNKCRAADRHSKLDKKRAYTLECRFKFALNEYPNKFDFDLVRKYGWYKAKNRGDNVGGVTRDHMISVDDGFKNNIPAEHIRHPANCQLLLFGKNVSKGKTSSITHTELLERIKNWK